MARHFAYYILFLNVVLSTFGHANGIRDVVANQDHFHKDANEVVRKQSLEFYYKTLTELSRKAFSRPGSGAISTEKFLFDFVKASYIGIFTPDNFYSGKVMPIYFPMEHNHTTLKNSEENTNSITTYPLSDLKEIFKQSQDFLKTQFLKNSDDDKCEIKPEEAETKVCAGDMESVLEFILKKFGSEGGLKIVETKQTTVFNAATLQEYMVMEDPQEIEGERKVFCHPMNQALYCHYPAAEAKVLKVSLATKNGDKMEAVAVCHSEKSGPNSNNNVLYHLLGARSGTIPSLCHFLPVGHLVWVQYSPTFDS